MSQSGRHAPQFVLTCGAPTIAISLGIRHGFRLFLQPISMEGGWGREVFSLPIAARNLVWGLAQPVMGLAANRLGAGKVVLFGAVLCMLGLLLTPQSRDPVAGLLHGAVRFGR